MELADLFVNVRVDSKPFDIGIGTVKTRLTGFAGSLKTMGAGMAASFGALGAAMGGAALFKGAITGAADLNETVSKTGVVFGAAAGPVLAFADEMAAAFGTSKQEVLDAASGFGLIGKAAGMSQEGAAGMAVQMARLADDASSFHNVPLADALGKIRSAMVGESEPIRDFGVFLTESSVAAEALSLGLVKNKNEMSEGAKVMARVSLIRKGMKDVEGDHARTQGEFSGQLRETMGRLKALGESIGAFVLPVLTKMLQLANPAIGFFTSLSNAVGKAGGAFASFAGAVAKSGFDTIAGMLGFETFAGAEERAARDAQIRAAEKAAAEAEAAELARLDPKEMAESDDVKEMRKKLAKERADTEEERKLEGFRAQNERDVRKAADLARGWKEGKDFSEEELDARDNAGQGALSILKEKFAQGMGLYGQFRQGIGGVLGAGLGVADALMLSPEEVAKRKEQEKFQSSFSGFSEARDKLMTATLSDKDKQKEMVERQKETIKAIDTLRKETLDVLGGLRMGLR